MGWFKNLFKKEILQEADDQLLWYRDLEKYVYGKYSYAAVRANGNREDYSQIIPGPDATFVGVYDGHNGHEASEFVSENLSKSLLRRIKNSQSTLREDIQAAFSETERGFLEKIETIHPFVKNLAIVGSSSLVGIMLKKTLILANLGDSRAVLGSYDSDALPFFQIRATQLTDDHSVESSVSVRHSLKVYRDGVYLLNGMPNLQTTRAIGDAYLKERRFNRAAHTSPFYVRNVGQYPMIHAEPEITHPRNIRLLDKFLIFASRGFWEHFTNEEVVEMVYDKPKAGITRRLIVFAMERAAQKKSTTYNAIKQIPAGEERRAIHEDMTVIVLFIDHMKFYKKPREDLGSVQAFAGRTGVANFRF